MSRQRQRKRKMPAIQKVLIVLIMIVSALLAVLVHYGITSRFDNTERRQDSATQAEPPETPKPTPRPREDVLTGVEHYNPLTGLPMDLGLTKLRPIAIVLNNLNQALPINGISDADIVYEYPVEGGLTRMLAFFQDTHDVEKIGSIRSARHYTVQFADSYDAILVAAGRSPKAQEEVRALRLPFLNEVEGPHREVFFRDRNRVPGKRFEHLHSVITTGERLDEWLPTYNFRLVHEEDYKHTLHFIEDGTPEIGYNANEITVKFSGAKTTTFTYDRDLKVYHSKQANVDLVDGNDNSRPGFSNILILKMPVTPLRGDTSGRLDIETTGKGEGYFISGGKYIEISWMRADKSFPFIYTLKDGTGFDLSIGKTYICILPTNIEPVIN